MREFFLNLLNNLHILAGLKQLDKIYAAHGEDEQGAKSEINKLLKTLCNVSDQFPFIPDAEKQKIISHEVVADPEFQSLNASIIYKWLNKNKDRYFKQECHTESKPDAEPLTGEARQRWLKEWEKALANFGPSFTPEKMTKAESEEQAKKLGQDWTSEIERKAVSTKIDPERQVYTVETLKERNERIRALQEKAFRDRNPGASEEEVKLFMEQIKKYEIPIPKKL